MNFSPGAPNICSFHFPSRFISDCIFSELEPKKANRSFNVNQKNMPLYKDFPQILYKARATCIKKASSLHNYPPTPLSPFQRYNTQLTVSV